MLPQISSKKLFIYFSLYFVLIFAINLALSLVNFKLNQDLNIWFLNYTLALSVFLLLPLVVGKLGLFWLYKVKLANSNDPIWVEYPIAWCAGHIILNLVAILSALTRMDYTIWILFVLIWLLNFFWRFEVDRFESNGTFVTIKNDTGSNFANSRDFFGRLKTVFRFKYFWLAFFVVVNLIFFGFWYSRMEFTSFNTDSLQNAHLANIFKREKVYSPLAIDVSPQYTQVDYTTVFTPNFALATEFFDFRQILYVMPLLEIIVSCLVIIVRYNFFRVIGLSKFASAAIAFLASSITFSGLYMSGTYYNQQVLVFCLPVLLYFLYKRRLLSAILTFLLLFPFHFTMSVFLLYVSGFFWFFWSLQKSSWFIKIIPFFHIGKYLFVAILFTILTLAALNTFEVNYLIVDKLLDIFATKPQYANTIGIYSNVAIIQIFVHAIGPILTSLLLCIPLIWLFTSNQLTKWSFFIVAVQIAILAVPFPVAGRTFVFFSLPFVLAIYFALQHILVKNYLVNIGLVLLMLSNLWWSVTVRTQDLDISGNYWSKAFLSRQYIDFLVLSSDSLISKNIQPTDYKVVSEYFVKHHFEVMAYKYDDSGVYQENKEERNLLFQFLNNSRADACEHYKVKYLVYLINERVYKWSRIPETLSKNSAFAVWWSNPTTPIESNYIFNFKPNTSGQIIEDKSIGDNRYILVKC
jgi:hypothetical protein